MYKHEEYLRKVEEERIKQIDEIASYLSEYIKKNATIRDMVINSVPDEKTIKKVMDIEIPRIGRNPKEVADELVENVYSKSMLIQHPRFFSFVASAVSPYSLAGSILSDIYNIHGGGYLEAPTACIIEEKIIKWMGSLAGYDPSNVGGLFVSGGSMANMTALIAARDNKLNDDEFALGVAYVSDQTHSSVKKGLRLIGIRPCNVRIIGTDDDFKMDLKELENTIIKDKENGLKPFVVIGTLGTTNTGTIDPLEKIGQIAKKYNLWFHVDGAYGASILISDIYRNLTKGMELSDSFSWDTHKWALQTYSCSSIIAKDKQTLIKSFAEHPEYLADISSEEHTDPWDMGPEMTRPHRSLKFWFTLQAMGTDSLADVIDYAIYNSKIVENKLKEDSNWEITSKPSCGAITFRYAPSDVEDLVLLNSMISNRINEDGYTFIVTTTIKNKKVLRMCVINANTTTNDVISTMDYLTKMANKCYQVLKNK